MSRESEQRVEYVTRRFHEVYEAEAPRFGYETRADTAVTWAELPVDNKRLMTATVLRLLKEEVITFGNTTWERHPLVGRPRDAS